MPCARLEEKMREWIIARRICQIQRVLEFRLQVVLDGNAFVLLRGCLCSDFPGKLCNSGIELCRQLQVFLDHFAGIVLVRSSKRVGADVRQPGEACISGCRIVVEKIE